MSVIPNDLYLSKKEHEQKLFHRIQPANGFKTQAGTENGDGSSITVTTQENAKKKTFGKRLVVPLDFNFFKHPVYPYGVKKYLIVCLIINSSEKVTFCSGDTAAT